MRNEKKIKIINIIWNMLLAVEVVIAAGDVFIIIKIWCNEKKVFLKPVLLFAVDLLVVSGLILYTLYKLKVEGEVDLENESNTGMPKQPVRNTQAVRVGPAMFGKTHNIGRRNAQQDSFGKTEVLGGQMVLAVVADGMGGLSGSDQISRRIVMGMLSYAAQLNSPRMDGILQQMVGAVNEEVNMMLGMDGLYKSGSTLLAVLADKDKFQWIAVGDSRIYLYRDGSVFQLNHEHTLLQEWMPDILAGELSYSEAVNNPESKKLTSFVGMGKLKHVDCSLRSMQVMPGDRILLMSDGVFNTLSNEEMSDILKHYNDVQQAANIFEQRILEAEMPGQDNFTSAILGF